MQVQNNSLSATAGQGQAAQAQANSSALKPAKSIIEEPATQKKATDQTPVYLKVLSRMENMLSLGEVPTIAVEGFNRAIKNRTAEMSDQEKTSLLKLPAAKVMGLENLEDLPDQIAEGMKDVKGSKKVLNLLKQPQFVKLMSNQGNAPVYKAQPAQVVAPAAHKAVVTSKPEVVAPAAHKAVVTSKHEATKAPSASNVTASYQPAAIPPKINLAKSA